MPSINDIKGIGPKTIEALEKAGLHTVEDIALLVPEELKAILGCGYMKAKSIIEDAKQLSLDSIVPVRTAEEVARERAAKIKIISTGAESFDKILGGGIETDAVYGFFGPIGTGKTQTCFTLMVNTLASGRSVYYIETEPSIFRLERVKEIAENRGIQIDPSKIHIVEAKFITSEEGAPPPVKLLLAYERAEQLIKNGEDIGLICVDSFVTPFRIYYQRRESYPERSKMVFKHFGTLQRLASQYNLAVILTIQAFSAPDTVQQGIAQAIFGSKKMPVGGDSVLHEVTIWVALEKTKTNLWKATVFDSSYLPRNDSFFVIGSRGIQDYGK